MKMDGRELFYVAADEKLMAVRIRIGSSGFEASAPQPLPSITVRAPFFPVFLYCPAANGQRFLVSEPVPGEHPRIAIVVNWQAGMER